MNYIRLTLFVSLLCLHYCVLHTSQGHDAMHWNDAVYSKIGQLIWRNECANSSEKLTWWNNGEEFASLGIGHFIWYPANEKKMFTQTFPDLLHYLHEHNVALPQWLESFTAHAQCPWDTREHFFASFENDDMRSLRAVLASTIGLQAKFMVLRTKKALAMLMMHESVTRKAHVRKIIQALQKTAQGMYVLIDYINFKGDGTNPRERYHGQGWGLLQVIENMPDNYSNDDLIDSFVSSAKNLLTLRVKHSPAARNEKKFLAGWINRLDSYKQQI